MSDFVQQQSVECRFDSSDSWVILSPIEQSIKRKIESVGTPLKDWDIQINYGIKTGFNDAFIINTDTCSSVALEPTYFDKTADYPTGCPDNQYLLSAQNCSATMDEEGHIQLVTEDIRIGLTSSLYFPRTSLVRYNL